MVTKYSIYEDDYAVLIAKAALLNAEVEGMKTTNADRISKGISIAYAEHDFYNVSDDLRETLASMEKRDE